MDGNERSTDAETRSWGRAGRAVATVGVVLLLVTSGIAASLGSAQAQSATGGDPDLEAYVPDPKLMPGSASTLTVQIANDASTRYGSPPERDRVTTARNVRVELDAGDAPLSVETAKRSVGSITENEPRSVPFAVEIPEDADRGPTRSTSR